MGRNADEQVALATVQGVFKDFYKKYLDLMYGNHGEKGFEGAKPAALNDFKTYLNKLNLLLQGKEYFCGEITYIDFTIAEFIQSLVLFDAPLIEGFPNLFEHQKRIFSLPAIKAYTESERFEERPVNYTPFAHWY